MGDEIWKAIPGYEKYDVSNLGRVRSWHEGRGHPLPYTMGQYRDGAGYLMVYLMKNGKGITKRVHLLVLEAFAGPRAKGMESSHLDGNRSNNSTTNLVWESHADNNRRRILHGTIPYGENNRSAKLNAELVREIRRKHAAGQSFRSLAREYNINRTSIRCVVNRSSWRHVA